MAEKNSFSLRLLSFMVLLYGFFLGLELMGDAFKLLGSDFARQLVEQTSNPFVGLVIGILSTSLIQSSSTTTSMTVMAVAGGLTIENAIPIIMGANIGTSVTNTLVSLAHVTRTEEFRRAFAAATVHDFFNWMAVLILFPLELATGYLKHSATLLEGILEGAGGLKLLNPVKLIVEPVADGLITLTGHSGTLTLIVGALFLFASLKLLVDLLKVILSARAEEILHRTLFRSAWHGLGAGVLITVMVQSSSITTSTAVPLVGAGIVTLTQMFPFTLGANIGTTVTPILAALSTGNPAALAVGLAHLLFNITGTVLIYPLPAIRRIPLFLAEKMGDLGARSRVLAGTYIITAFFALPILLLLLFGSFGESKEEAQENGANRTPVTSGEQKLLAGHPRVIPSEGVAKGLRGLRGLKGRKGRKGQEALRRRFGSLRTPPRVSGLFDPFDPFDLFDPFATASSGNSIAVS